MKAICVDGNATALARIVELCRKIVLLDEVRGFASAREALAWLEGGPADLALLDIHLPDMDGLELARAIQREHPRTAILFVSTDAGRAMDAYEVHASGYLLKPVNAQRLRAEVEYALGGARGAAAPRVAARTFGEFELLVDGEVVAFKRSRAKELLAYLIDRSGAGITRFEAFSALWGQWEYNLSMQKQLDVVIRSLRDTLREYGVESIFELKSRSLRVLPERLDCDLYRVLSGDTEALNGFTGAYMAQYRWGAETEKRLSRMKGDRK